MVSSFFLRNNLLTVHASDQFWLIAFWFSLLLLLVSSYEIDVSCRNYKGNDISEDVQQAINEVQDMAQHAHMKIDTQVRSQSTVNLFQALFGEDSARARERVGLLFAAYPGFPRFNDFVIICDDLTVQLVPDTHSTVPNPHGMWTDTARGWISLYNDWFSTCDPTRIPTGNHGVGFFAYSVENFIYVCPSILDSPKGRTLAPYRNQLLIGQFLDQYILLPVTLFHELSHTEVINPIRKFSLHIIRHHIE